MAVRMSILSNKFQASPELARSAPFAVYAVLTFFQSCFAPGSYYWLYVVKTLVGAWVVWEVRSLVKEMQWKVSVEAVVVGVGVFALWVGLDGRYPRLSEVETPNNPYEHFGAGSVLAWSYVLVHLAGSTIVVPPVEEIFYRSWLYRYFVKIDFLAMPLSQFHGLSFFVTSVLFGLMHPSFWVVGILCGLAYQWLVIRKGRLGDAMTAHAITNFLLGLWVIWRGAWHFW